MTVLIPITGALNSLVALTSLILFGVAQKQLAGVYYDDEFVSSGPDGPPTPHGHSAAIAGLVMSATVMGCIVAMTFAHLQNKIALLKILCSADIVFAMGLLVSAAIVTNSNMIIDANGYTDNFVSNASKTSGPFGLIAALCSIAFAVLTLTAGRTILVEASGDDKLLVQTGHVAQSG